MTATIVRHCAQSAKSSLRRPDKPARPRLNFLVIGQVRSGMGVVADTLSNHGGATCHAGLFAADAADRKAAHEAYFGAAQARRPHWFCFGDRELEGRSFTNPYDYITTVLDAALYGEQAVGLCLPYAVLARFQLYDLVAELTARGDFCVVHTVRNPVEGYVSLAQAEESGQWVRYRTERGRYVAMPLFVDPAAVAEFVDATCCARDKLRLAAADGAELDYADLPARYDDAARRLFRFLELEPRRPVCRTRRVVDLPLCKRVLNYDELRRKLPVSMRHWLT